MRHRFTSDSKRRLARTRKVNFACFLVGSKKAGEKREIEGIVTVTLFEGGNVQRGSSERCANLPSLLCRR